MPNTDQPINFRPVKREAFVTQNGKNKTIIRTEFVYSFKLSWPEAREKTLKKHQTVYNPSTKKYDDSYRLQLPIASFEKIIKKLYPEVTYASLNGSPLYISTNFNNINADYMPDEDESNDLYEYPIEEGYVILDVNSHKPDITEELYSEKNIAHEYPKYYGLNKLNNILFSTLAGFDSNGEPGFFRSHHQYNERSTYMAIAFMKDGKLERRYIEISWMMNKTEGTWPFSSDQYFVTLIISPFKDDYCDYKVVPKDEKEKVAFFNAIEPGYYDSNNEKTTSETNKSLESNEKQSSNTNKSFEKNVKVKKKVPYKVEQIKQYDSAIIDPYNDATGSLIFFYSSMIEEKQPAEHITISWSSEFMPVPEEGLIVFISGIGTTQNNVPIIFDFIKHPEHNSETLTISSNPDKTIEGYGVHVSLDKNGLGKLYLKKELMKNYHRVNLSVWNKKSEKFTAVKTLDISPIQKQIGNIKKIADPSSNK